MNFINNKNIYNYEIKLYINNFKSYISNVLYYCISQLQIKCSIVHSIKPNESENVIYIISTNYIQKDLPPKYILYEISTNIYKNMTTIIKNKILNCIEFWNYSLENITNLKTLKLNTNLIYMQIPLINLISYNNLSINNKTIDVLVYGSDNIHQLIIFNNIKNNYINKFNIKYIKSCKQNQINYYINISKIILYFTNTLNSNDISVINNIILCKTIPIIESSSIIIEYNKYYYNNKLHIFDKITSKLNNIQNIYSKINYLLNNNEYENEINSYILYTKIAKINFMNSLNDSFNLINKSKLIISKESKLVITENPNPVIIKQTKPIFKKRTIQVVSEEPKPVHIEEPITIICLIAMWSRQNLVQINIDCLKNQTLQPTILLIVSNESDKQFAIKNNVNWIYTDNKPLGKKWQLGLEACKKFNPNAILINGSDDILDLYYIENCYQYIKKKYCVVGNNNWYIIDLLKLNSYKLQYKNKNLLIGAGRMISRTFLDKINWNLYPLHKDLALDSHCNLIFTQNNAKLYSIENNCKIISLKGKQEMINPLNKILKATNKINILPMKKSDEIKLCTIGKYINNNDIDNILLLLK